MKVAIFALENSRKKYVDEILELFKSVDGIIEFEKVDAEDYLQYQYNYKKKLNITDILNINNEVRKNYHHIDYNILLC